MLILQYEDISRKHANLESEAFRAAERADNEERKISELEEELKVIISDTTQAHSVHCNPLKAYSHLSILGTPQAHYVHYIPI